ncbi:MAG: hypothetical protein JWM11_7566, partial [Planctomycetaceae bacterium]|nr:hypothetical protein [Planctomycetaceae bacterium]
VPPFGLNDLELAENFVETSSFVKFVCSTIRFEQKLIQDPDGKSKLSVTITPDFSEEKVILRLKTLSRIKVELKDSLDNLQAKLKSITEEKEPNEGLLDLAKNNLLLAALLESDKKALERAKIFQPFALIRDIEKLALELDWCFEEDPARASSWSPRKPLSKYDINIAAAMTLKELHLKGDFPNLQSYLTEVQQERDAIEPNKLELRARNQLLLVKNQIGELDLLAKNVVLRFKAIEVHELCRRIDNRWIPIYKTEDVLKKE